MDDVDEIGFDDLINSEELTVVDFSATWCMPCRMLKPIIERVANTMTDVSFYNLDIDENEDIAKRYRIFSVPTLLCFKEGKKVDSLVGLNSYDDIVAFIEHCKTVEIEEE